MLESSMHQIVGQTCSAIGRAMRGEEPDVHPSPTPHHGGSRLPPPGDSHSSDMAIDVDEKGRVSSQCFQILGFDLMFCEAADDGDRGGGKSGKLQARAHLLEVNSS
eukprot:COSAG05_NODE_10894_length_540_cov_1.106576_1_plen_105_part_01